MGPDAATGSPRASQPAWEFSATGTRWRVYHDGSLPATVAEEVRGAIGADEARWSRFRADSECSAINDAAGRWVPVSPETFELLAACVAWSARTGGVFNPLTGAALRAWGYARSFDTAEGRDRGSAGKPRAVVGAVELDDVARRVRIPRGAYLDLGGIGKGWIAGRAAELLGCRVPRGEILLDAGGDLVAVGGDHRVAIESIRGPGAPELGFVELNAGEAIATSGYRHRQWTTTDGHSAHHLIDPRTGAPGPRAHATVVAANPVSADVLAKVLALRPESVTGVPHRALVQYNDRLLASASWRFAE